MEMPEGRSREGEAREFRITDRLLDKYGYSDECPGCDHKRQGLPGRIGGHLSHSIGCRERLRRVMMEDARDRDILEQAEKRKAAPLPSQAAAPQPSQMDPKSCHGGSQETKSNEPNADTPTHSSSFEDLPEELVSESEDEADDLMTVDEEGSAPQAPEDPLADLKRRFDDEDADSDDEPGGKRPKLSTLQQPNAFVHAAQLLLTELTEAKKNVDVQKILAELEKDPRFQVAKNRRQRRTHARRARTATEVDVAEIYSPPRITEMGRRMGIRDGWALDLTQIDPEDG